MALIFQVEISCDNDAFEPRWAGEQPMMAASDEVARILRDLSKQINICGGLPANPLPLYDINGNKVGVATFKKE